MQDVSGDFDVVFGEHLPIRPEVLVLPGIDLPVPGASTALSLVRALVIIGGGVSRPP